MGKHTADDDSTVDPLVADALARRGDAAPAAHGEHSGGSTGWPGPAPGGGAPVGWPGGTGPAPDDAPQEPAEADAERAMTPVVRPASAPAPVAVRRGWRRLFGASPAA